MNASASNCIAGHFHRCVGRLGFVIALMSAAFSPVPSLAADNDPFENLRRRIENLESDNRELRASQIKPSHTPVTLLGLLEDEASVEMRDDAEMELPPGPSIDMQSRVSDLETKLDALGRMLEVGGPLNPDVMRSTDIHPLPSSNKTPTYPNVRMTGFFQLDAGFFSQNTNSLNQFGRVQNDSGFRRTRLAAVGDVSDNVSYMIEMDFAFPGRPSFMDVFMDLHGVPIVGNVKIGQWRQPFGMDNLTSVRELTFLERPLSFGFAPFRETGIGFYDLNDAETITWAASAYGYPADAWGNAFGNKGFGTAERITALLMDQDESRHLLHVGFDHCYTVPGPNGVAYRNTNEYGAPFGSGVAPTFPGAAGGGGSVGDLPLFVNTGPLLFNNANLFNAELAGVYNSFHWQSELTYSVVDFAGGTVTLPSYYARAAYILTGEVRPYNKRAAVLGRIKPLNPWTRCGGCGAWEIAGQYSYINLNPAAPFQTRAQEPAQPGGPNIAWGGAMNNYSTALNWYINNYTKFQLEYILSDMNRGGVDSMMSTMCMRAQLDF